MGINQKHGFRLPTDRQREVLRFVMMMRDAGEPVDSVAIAGHFGISTAAVFDHLRPLLTKGCVSWTPAAKGTLGVTDLGRWLAVGGPLRPDYYARKTDDGYIAHKEPPNG